MSKAEELEQTAEKKKKAKDKPLPALVSPTVNLAIELRQAIALRCKDTGESFSIVTNKMWFEMLKKEGKVKPDLVVDFSARRVGGGGGKKKLEEKNAEIAALQKELAMLKASKK